ncbi:MAG: Asp-tRNA(Asn)/Glu-tRNA(Gln) amidotransferase subunit GatA [Desulfobacteraceae bacterium]|nr:Asp-tRNA(Asn)/Glu-tRNA(Gln) amidotransferase subunit GatA [Desulfobacteraceae bacterium]
MNLYEHTASQLLDLIKNKKTTPEKILGSIRQRIKSTDKKINGYVLVNEEPVQPASINGELAGIPIAVKDNICVEGERTTCGSKILEGFIPPYDATVIKKLRQAGATLLGKTNMDEFAFGSSCETSTYGPTLNPWNLKHVPGGSSGGSAAVVSAGEAVMALGSDTGGSIRQPAAFCGVVGLKPTYGRVSRYGLIAFASSLDQIGPITKDVRDAALLLNVIAGHDEKDSTSAKIEVPDYTKSLLNDVKGLRIGIPKECFKKGLDREVEQSLRRAIKLFESLGAKSEEISLPYLDYAVSCYYIVGPAEASSNLARFDGVQYGLRVSDANDLLQMYEQTREIGFGSEAKRRIILGTYVLSSGYYDAYYLKALKVRTLIKEDFEKIFKKYDCIITPTSPTPAFKIGEKINDLLSMYLSDIFTAPINLAGIPAISIPCGFTEKNLPLGLQIIGKAFSEETLFRVAYTFEQNTDYHLRKPVIKD